MFLKFYGLQEQPFGVTPDPRYLYMSSVHREALDSLVYGIEAGLGFSTLIAEPGMGKTTLLNRILGHFRSSARTAFIFETQCNSHQLLRNLLLDLEVGDAEDDTDNIGLLDQLKQYSVGRATRCVRALSRMSRDLKEDGWLPARSHHDSELRRQPTCGCSLVMRGRVQVAQLRRS